VEKQCGGHARLFCFFVFFDETRNMHTVTIHNIEQSHRPINRSNRIESIDQIIQPINQIIRPTSKHRQSVRQKAKVQWFDTATNLPSNKKTETQDIHSTAYPKTPPKNKKNSFAISKHKNKITTSPTRHPPESPNRSSASKHRLRPCPKLRHA